jgi:CheY-like chemotaxis protein/signal transduction histidine kinase
MLTSNLKFISRFNDLRVMAGKGTPEFFEQFCEFICEEFQFHSAAIFKVNESKKLFLIGKSASARKTLQLHSVYECSNCKLLKKDSENFEFQSNPECEIHSAETGFHECCLTLVVSENERYFLKIANKTPFTPIEKDFFKITGQFLLSVLESVDTKNIHEKASFGKFIVEAANEFRTPTNSIVGFASLLGDEKLTSAQAEYVITLKENAQKMLSLINDFVDYSKSEAGILAYNTSLVQMNDVVEEVLGQFSAKSLPAGVAIEKQIDKSIPDSIKSDVIKIKYILQQFIQFMVNVTEAGKISLSVSVGAQGRIVVRMTNKGTILPIQNLANVFNGNALLDLKSMKNSPVTVLSLPLAKRYIDALGGTLEIASSQSKGIGITFSIPYESLNPIEAKIGALPKIEGKNKVLVIEDDYATSKLLSNYLNKWGYEPLIINSGVKAFQMLQKEKFLAVIMDIVLPDINGLELLKKIREDEHSRFTPVIVCSVEAEQQKAFMMGAVEYFVKPIRYKDLVEVLTSYKLKKDSNILCVDDDVPTLNLVKSAIESVGFNAIAESKSTKVMDMIKNVQLDLAIIDLDMPDINGFELIKLIKTSPKFANLPIIIYTGKENFEDDLQKIDGLFTELLSKRSTKIEDLADTINAMINRYEQPTPPEDIKAENDTPKILLVEDYKHSQIIVTRLLKKNSFNNVIVVENGAEAIEQVKLHEFDLILMDMQMPVMNGFEATERIRQIPEYKETPIIALTAFAMKGDREKCLEAGATDYIPKPIDSQEFIEKVKHYTSMKFSS